MFLATHPAIAYTVLQGSKHGVQTKYWSYFQSDERQVLRAVRPIRGHLARIRVFVISQTRASSEYMGKGKCAPFFMH